MSRRVFLDTNVLLDHLMDRRPFADDAAEIWSMAERREIVGYVSGITFPLVYYLVRRWADRRAATRAVRGMLDIFEIVTTDSRVVGQAVESPVPDFEDAIQYHSAMRIKALLIVTRNIRHFRNSEIPVLAPDAFLAQLDVE